jgi:hypothetical protein
MTQDEIIEIARQAGLFTHKEVQPEIVTFAKLVAAKERLENPMREVQRLGQEIEQKPVAWQFLQNGKWHNGTEFHSHRKNTEAAGIPIRDLYTHPPQRTEQNFCSRCGKRTRDLITIHTCTPPQEGA